MGRADQAAQAGATDEALARAIAARQAGDPLAALDLYRQAAANPGNVIAAQNLGALLTQLGRAEEAEPILRRALALAPQEHGTRHSLAITLMTLGRYPEAWDYYRSRFELPRLRHARPTGFPFPAWQGEPVAGRRIAIFPEQGFGDQIQYARFVPPLRAAAAQVTLLTPGPLVRLFAHSFPGADVVPASGAVEFPDPHFWAMSSDLPNMLGATPETLPRPPYLRTAGSWPAPAAGFAIGLKTRGNPDYAEDALRSLPPELDALLRSKLPGEVISLDPDETGAKDFADTAALIERLDLVVSVDTSVAHLAGALGKPAFVLVPGFAADWRWGIGREDSDWYPSHRLFRGSIDEGWAPAIDRLADAAHELMESSRR